MYSNSNKKIMTTNITVIKMKFFILEKLALLLVFIGGLNWGLVGAFDYNLVEVITRYFNIENSKDIIYIIVGMSALFFMFKRNTYLPFLGKTAHPCFSLEDVEPENPTKEVVVSVPPDTKVLYWAAEKSKDGSPFESPQEAYNDYKNYGVTTSDENGNAILRFRTPTGYFVKTGKLIDSHVHFRYCKKPGMLSEVKTHYL